MGTWRANVSFIQDAVGGEREVGKMMLPLMEKIVVSSDDVQRILYYTYHILKSPKDKVANNMSKKPCGTGMY